MNYKTESMKKTVFLFVAIGSSFLSNFAFAFTECLMTPDKVWMNGNGISVWICFENRNCIYKSYSNQETVNHTLLDRMYSSGLSAIAANKDFYLRFPEDDGDCNIILTNGSRDDFVGYWVFK